MGVQFSHAGPNNYEVSSTVEQGTHNPLVTCSNHVSRTKSIFKKEYMTKLSNDAVTSVLFSLACAFTYGTYPEGFEDYKEVNDLMLKIKEKEFNFDFDTLSEDELQLVVSAVCFAATDLDSLDDEKAIKEINKKLIKKVDPDIYELLMDIV
jgi:hypothetical protein